MSNRYRVAFKETLCCGKHSKNGFSREHSSFRETTLSHKFDGTQLVRIRSVEQQHLVRYSSKNRTCRKQNSVQWQGLLENEAKEDDSNQDVKRTDVVVVITPTVNGKTKSFSAQNTNDSANHIVTNNVNNVKSENGSETCI